MVKAAEVDCLTPPEIKLARRLLRRRGLSPRIDVYGLLCEYASVEFDIFPMTIDGLCLDLKAWGKRPRVIVEKRAPSVRQRFTLAHELGHVLIPWHFGRIVDSIDLADSPVDDYFELESEANRFASELLMPEQWVRDQIGRFDDPLQALLEIARAADVSVQAARIKFLENLQCNHVLAFANDGIVDWSSRSAGTIAATVPRGFDLTLSDPYPFECARWTVEHNRGEYRLWRFPTSHDASLDKANEAWREILDRIVADILPDFEGRKQFKASINGVTSNANGMVRANRNPDTIMAAMWQRLHARALEDLRYEALVQHPELRSFCSTRAHEYARK